MRHLIRIVLMLAIAACLISGADVWAKGGRGGSKKGGGFKSGGSQKFRHSRGVRGGAGKAANPKWQRKATPPVKQGAANRPYDTRQVWNKHYAREQRKLEHRKEIANHLREISDRNGNEQLKRVADDMEQRAQAHYDKQLNKIRQGDGLDSLDDTTTEVTDAVTDVAHNSSSGDTVEKALDEAARKLTGRENALVRQLRNEERKLSKRMETVERLRQLAEQSGDHEMVQAADRLEEWAMTRYDQRMAQITNFQQRHDLPDVSDFLSP